MTSKNAKPIQDEQELLPSFTYDDGLLESANVILEMAEEIEDLKAQIAVEHMDASVDQKRAAIELIDGFKSQIKTLEAVNRSLQSRSNLNMNQVSELMSQIRYWKRRAKKAEERLS